MDTLCFNFTIDRPNKNNNNNNDNNKEKMENSGISESAKNY